MQSLTRDSLLSHLRVAVCRSVKDVSAARGLHRQLCTSTTGSTRDQITARVIGLVSQFVQIDASKVTALADFQKDLSLDSLDTVELVMTFVQEFDIEIPNEDADKLKCCADFANYIKSPKQDTV